MGYKLKLIRTHAHSNEEILWSSKYITGNYNDAIAYLINNELFDLSVTLLQHTTETLDPKTAANLKDAYANDDIEAVTLVEHVKEWLGSGLYQCYYPINPSGSEDGNIYLTTR